MNWMRRFWARNAPSIVKNAIAKFVLKNALAHAHSGGNELYNTKWKIVMNIYVQNMFHNLPDLQPNAKNVAFVYLYVCICMSISIYTYFRAFSFSQLSRHNRRCWIFLSQKERERESNFSDYPISSFFLSQTFD